RVAGVVRVQQVDLPHDRSHPVDGIGEILSGRVGVTGVEAEADVHARLRLADGLPEQGEGVEAAADRVVPSGRVLDVDGDLRLEHLEGPRPAAHPLGNAVLGVAGVDDHGRRPDVRGRLAGLLEDLARSVADVVAGGADVDQVWGMDVERRLRRLQLLRVL